MKSGQLKQECELTQPNAMNALTEKPNPARTMKTETNYPGLIHCKPQTGFYILPAHAPCLREMRINAELIGTFADGSVMLNDLDMEAKGCPYLIHTAKSNFAI